jgi:plastocyanin
MLICGTRLPISTDAVVFEIQTSHDEVNSMETVARKWDRRDLIGLVIGAAGGAVLGPGIWEPIASVGAAVSTVTIPGDYYIPVSIMIEAGQAVTWLNKDSDPHVSTSAPGAPMMFTLVHAPGKSSSFTFSKAGLYPYYCVDHATYNVKLHRVVARKEADLFPLAMEGLIVVKGPELTGNPSASVSISGSGYAPDIAMVKSGGKVTWTNADTAEHTVTLVGAGAGALALPAGKGQTVSFAKPGVYLFYDQRYATYNSKVGLAAARKGVPNYPVALQGFVVVL